MYVHAKICVMDDWWATVGSDNFSRRSWTHDSELSIVVLDTVGGDHGAYARRLRLTLAAEHLDRKVGPAKFPGDISRIQTGTAPGDLDDATLLATMADCVAPQEMFDVFAASAARLQAWVDHGRQGERPPGRLRPIRDPELSMLTRLWAAPLYRVVHDPDGRPRRYGSAVNSEAGKPANAVIGPRTAGERGSYCAGTLRCQVHDDRLLGRGFDQGVQLLWHLITERFQVVEDLQGGRLGQRPPLLVAGDVLAPAHGLAVGSGGPRPTPTNA